MATPLIASPLPKSNHRADLHSFYNSKPLPSSVLNFHHNKKTNLGLNLRTSCLANKTLGVDDSYIPLIEAEERNLGRNLSSKRAFWDRKWNLDDIVNFGLFCTMHLLCLFAPLCFNWRAFWVAFGLYIVTGFGITLGYHRNLTHRSFKLPKWLEYAFAYCGVQAFQRDPIFWVSTHRFHHQFGDTERDPHSPLEGFWFSHFNWLFDTDYIIEKCGERKNVEDLEKQPFYKFLQKTYFWHPIALGILLYALGGFPFIVWGMGVRILCSSHITFLANSVGHKWGKRTWNTNDSSRNNWWMALFTLGEGWHNNHHAFEFSARYGLEWWELDISWYVVRFLEVVGLATDVKLPTEAQKQKLALKEN